jgi:hypothetical protein
VIREGRCTRQISDKRRLLMGATQEESTRILVAARVVYCKRLADCQRVYGIEDLDWRFRCTGCDEEAGDESER